MILANIGAFLLTPLLVFPSFGSNGDFSAFFEAPRAEAQESRFDRGRDWGSWWDWRPNPNDDRPEIDAIDPESGVAGSEVTLSGENFSDDSTVRFGRETIEDVDVSDDGTELTFTVPEDANERRYNVRVHGDDGRSNMVRFEVTAEDDDGDNENDELAITEIDGPTTLSVDEEGSWTVHVDGTYDGNLRYSVEWGDEENMLARIFGADEDEMQSSATFTHTYGEEGTYTPEFTVTDEDGNTVTKASASVAVGEDGELRIDSIDPVSASAGSEVTIEGDGFDADAIVRFGGNTVADVTVEDDSTITFTVPELEARAYNVVVRSDGERSNAIRFTVTEEEVDGRVSVSGVSAPTRLEVGENGEWTVHADTNLDGNLRYSVEWGDENQMARSMMSAEATTQSSATFSHVYYEEGTYHPTFTVTNEDGQSARVSASGVVADDDESSD